MLSNVHTLEAGTWH